MKKAKNGHICPLKVKKAIENFHKKAGEYSIRGKSRKQDRITVAANADDFLGKYNVVLGDICKDFDKNQIVNAYGVKAKDAKLETIKEFTERCYNLYQGFAPLNKLEQANAGNILEERLVRGDALAFYDRHLISAIGSVPDTNKKMSAAEVAKLMVYEKHKNWSRGADVTVEQLNQRRLQITEESVSNEINELSSSKIFKMVAERFQTDTAEKWNEVKERAEQLHNNYQSFTIQHRGNAGLRYIMHSELTTKNVRDKYDKLGEVVAKQILSTPRNNQLVQGVAAGLIDYKDVQRACTAYFKNKGTLEIKNFDQDVFIQKLDNGTLKNEAIAKIAEPIQKEAERKAKQQMNQQKEKNKEKNGDNKDNKMERFKK